MDGWKVTNPQKSRKFSPSIGIAVQHIWEFVKKFYFSSDNNHRVTNSINHLPDKDLTLVLVEKLPNWRPLALF